MDLVPSRGAPPHAHTHARTHTQTHTHRPRYRPAPRHDHRRTHTRCTPHVPRWGAGGACNHSAYSCSKSSLGMPVWLVLYLGSTTMHTRGHTAAYARTRTSANTRAHARLGRELAVAATGPHVRVHADVLDGSEPGVCAFPRHDRPRGLVDLKEARTACSPGIAVPVTIDALGIAACGHGRSGSDAGGRDLSHGSRTRSSRQAWELRGGCSRGKPQRSVCWQHAAHVARLGSCGRLLSR